jgi:hypothetical protein
MEKIWNCYGNNMNGENFTRKLTLLESNSSQELIYVGMKMDHK